MNFFEISLIAKALSSVRLDDNKNGLQTFNLPLT